MGKMKKGTNVGLDKNYDNICVGDTIIDENETEYVINAYGVAVDSTSGGTKKLSELKGIELVKSEKAPEKTPPDTEEKEIEKIHAAVKDAGDQTLVDELRARGWTVVCSKQVEKVIYETVEL